jgi:hypothetical protein
MMHPKAGQRLKADLDALGQRALQYQNRCQQLHAVILVSHGHRFCGFVVQVPAAQRSEVLYNYWVDCGCVVDEMCRRVDGW